MILRESVNKIAIKEVAKNNGYEVEFNEENRISLKSLCEKNVEVKIMNDAAEIAIKMGCYSVCHGKILIKEFSKSLEFAAYLNNLKA